ncbi:MAG: hypothetical protein RBS39_08905 [Phycisphaerales bacterium]|nr:hypothetical protein [Phycisphaerales bacterium]
MLGKNAHISRSAASRGRLLAQGGLVVVLAMTALAWWKWSSGTNDAPLPPLTIAGGEASGPRNTPRSAPSRRTADVDSISGSLLNVSNAYHPPANAEIPDLIIDTPTTNGNSDDPVRFLGLIEEGERRLALLSVKGSQRVVAEGDEYAPGAKLLGAAADVATIQDDSGRRRIQLATRTGPKISSGVLPVLIAQPTPSVIGRVQPMSDTEARRNAAADRMSAERMRANRDAFERRREAAQAAGAVAEQQGEEEGQH